jgi:hypothetical protein
MPTKRVRRGPRRIGAAVPGWVRRLIEHGEEPPLNTDAETAYVGWYFWNEPVPGLPDADSAAGQAIRDRIRQGSP